MESIEDIVLSMRTIGNMLIEPVSSIQGISNDKKNGIIPLKTRYKNIDGYDLVITFDKSKYSDLYLERCSFFGRYQTFLPFSLIKKIACKFLGNEYLSLVESVRGDKKVYNWYLFLDLEGNPQPFVHKQSEDCVFDDWHYRLIPYNY